MSKTEPDLIHTQFPDAVSDLMDIRDPYASEVPLLNQYNEYYAAGNTNAAEQLLADNPNLQKCIINAYIILKLHHDIIAVQRTFNKNVNGYITDMKNSAIQEVKDVESEYTNKVNTKYQNFSDKVDEDYQNFSNKIANTDSGIDTKVSDAKQALQTAVDNFEAYIQSLCTYEGAFDSRKTYNKFQVVTYVVGETTNAYMVVANSTTGNLPTSDSFIPITLKGDKGDTGLGLAPRGVYDSNLVYHKDDMVSYNHKLWFAKQDNFSGKTPSDGSVYWEQCFELSQSADDIMIDSNTNLTTTLEGFDANIQNVYNTTNKKITDLETKLESDLGGIKFSVENGILCCTYDDGQ